MTQDIISKTQFDELESQYSTPDVIPRSEFDTGDISQTNVSDVIPREEFERQFPLVSKKPTFEDEIANIEKEVDEDFDIGMTAILESIETNVPVDEIENSIRQDKATIEQQQWEETPPEIKADVVRQKYPEVPEIEEELRVPTVFERLQMTEPGQAIIRLIDRFKATGKELKEDVSTYLETQQPATKLAVTRPDLVFGDRGIEDLPEEELQQVFDTTKKEWPDIIREHYPVFNDPESFWGTTTIGQLAPELAGILLGEGTKPSTYAFWYAMERLIPAVAKKIFSKLPKGFQNFLAKERHFWGTSPIDKAARILGVKKDASLEEINKAFRAKAVKLHPDKPGGSEEAFKRVNQAHDMLKTHIAGKTPPVIPKQIEGKVSEIVPEVAPKVKPDLQAIVKTGEKVTYKGVSYAIQKTGEGAKPWSVVKLKAGGTIDHELDMKSDDYVEKMRAEAKPEVPVEKPVSDKVKVSLLKKAEQALDRGDITPQKFRELKTKHAVPIEKAEKVIAEKPIEKETTVRLKDTPRKYTLVEELRPTPEEKGLGEKYFSIKDSQTGEIQVVEQGDIQNIKRPEVVEEIPVPTIKERETPIGEVGKKNTEIEKISSTSAESILESLLVEEAGFAKVPSFDKLKEAEITKDVQNTVDKIGNIFTRYRNIDDLAREEFVRFEETLASDERQAARLSYDIFKEINKENRKAFQLWFENPTKYPKPPIKNIDSLSNLVTDLQEDLLKLLKEKGYDIGKYPDSWIQDRNNQVEQLTNKLGKIEGIKKKKDIYAQIKALQGEIKQLENMRYLHRITKPTAKSKTLKLFRRRQKSLSTTPYEFMGRKFPDIESAEKAGFKVADISEAIGNVIQETYYIQKADNLIKAINENQNFALPKSKAPSDWVEINKRQFPRSIGNKYHPAMASAIDELTYTHNYYHPIELLTKTWDKINVLFKMIGFYNPVFMTKYDIEQGWRAAGVKFFANIPKATKIWAKKDDTYYKLMEGGLYNKAFDYRKGADILVKDMLDKAEKSFGKRFAEKLAKALSSPIDAPLKAITWFNNKTTWQIDEILRTATWLGIQDTNVTKGLSQFQTIDLANDFMAAYNKFPKASKKYLNRVIFTPTYKVSMLRLLKDMYTHPKRFAAPLIRHQTYKQFIRWILPMIIGAYVAKKYSDEETEVFSELGYRIAVKIGDKEETVYSFSSPLLEETKLAQRKPLQSLKYNMSAGLQLMTTALKHAQSSRNVPADDIEAINEYFKIGAPVLREIENWRDKDKTNADKFLSQLGLAYSYSRIPASREQDDRPALIQTLSAMDLWLNWRKSEEKRELEKAERRYRYYFEKLYSAITREDIEERNTILKEAKKEFGMPYPVKNVYNSIRQAKRKKRPGLTREEQQLEYKNKFLKRYLEKTNP